MRPWRRALTDLTEREREVLRLLLGGHTAKSAASELDLSVHTVNDYLREARKKLGVSSSREAARILGEQEAQTPQKQTSDLIGMGGENRGSDDGDRQQTPGPSRMWLWITGVIVMFALALAAALAFNGSDHPPADKDTAQTQAVVAEDSKAETAALAFATLVDAGDYTESWKTAGPMFRSAVTADGWAAQVEPVRTQLGTLVSRELLAIEAHTSLPGAPAGDYRMVMFASDFSAAPNRTETVVLSKEDGRWGVVGYFVR